MFNIFKGKANEAVVRANQQLPEAKADKEKTEIGSDVVIHAMPEHFRFEHIKVSQAKTTGLIIIAGGVVFLLVISGLFYYFLTKDKVSQTAEPMATAPASEQAKTEEAAPSQPTEPSAATTTAANLPAEITEATSTDITAESDIVSGAADLTIGADSDSDGLTDEEERIFGSNSGSLDSDSDGYNDQTEILNLYNPAGAGPISVNPNVEVYQNKTYNYSLIYPQNWSQTISGGDDSIMFKAGDNSFIQIIAQINDNHQPIEEWYKEQFNIVAIDEANIVLAGSWQGVKNSDGLTVYLVGSSKKYIFTLTYNPAANNILNYPTLFQAIIKSFRVIE